MYILRQRRDFFFGGDKGDVNIMQTSFMLGRSDFLFDFFLVSLINKIKSAISENYVFVTR